MDAAATSKRQTGSAGPPAGDLPTPGMPPVDGLPPLPARPAGLDEAGSAPAQAVAAAPVAGAAAGAAAAPSQEPPAPAADAVDDVVIRVRGLQTRFGRTLVHDELDLDVRRGEVLGVVGGSGTGKTVLLRTIIGLNRPTAGRIEVLGQDVAALAPAERRALEQRWGVAFQDGALFSSLTVAQNVEVPLREHLRLPQRLMDEIAAMKISMVGLPADAGAKFPSELSGGMRKRAALARALAMDPEIVFLDEPTAGLDPIGAAAYDELIGRLQENLGLTVFMVTHDLDSLYAICDRIAVLAEKRVLVIGTLEEMLMQDHPWIHDYFHGPRARAATEQSGRTGKHPGASPP